MYRKSDDKEEVIIPAIFLNQEYVVKETNAKSIIHVMHLVWTPT